MDIGRGKPARRVLIYAVRIIGFTVRKRRGRDRTITRGQIRLRDKLPEFCEGRKYTISNISTSSRSQLLTLGPGNGFRHMKKWGVQGALPNVRHELPLDLVGYAAE